MSTASSLATFLIITVAVGLTEAAVGANATANALDNLLFGPACSRESFRAVRKICETISPICPSSNSTASNSTASNSTCPNSSSSTTTTGGCSTFNKKDNTFCTDPFTTVENGGSVKLTVTPNDDTFDCIFVIANSDLSKQIKVQCTGSDTSLGDGKVIVLGDETSTGVYINKNYVYDGKSYSFTRSGTYLRLVSEGVVSADKTVTCTWNQVSN